MPSTPLNLSTLLRTGILINRYQVSFPKEPNLTILCSTGQNREHRILIDVSYQQGFASPLYFIVLNNIKQIDLEILSSHNSTHLYSIAE
jgi:hypothetical protein